MEDHTKEQEKFDTLSKKVIKKLSPDEYAIPEITGLQLKIFEKISGGMLTLVNLEDGWNVKLASGFNMTNDADLFLEHGKGWPVFEGKTIHQFTQKWAKTQFIVSKKSGLKRLNRIRAFIGECKEIHNSYRLVFRRVAGSTNTRTCISTIISPHTFHAYTVHHIILTKSKKIILNYEYYIKISYLCGILNSLTFDFIVRSKTQTDLPTIIATLPLPEPIHEKRIAELVAKLLVGTPEFEEFAEIFHIENKKLTPAQKIKVTAEIDALVAHSYGLTLSEYKTIIDTFPLFKRNPALYDADDIVWDNKNIKEFYGEMASLALEYFEEISK